ncbi:hypothetical protein [Mesorhizobium sp. AA22]|nr:hypothetical protein [Mesorhizobium sp. AA22]
MAYTLKHDRQGIAKTDVERHYAATEQPAAHRADAEACMTAAY